MSALQTNVEYLSNEFANRDSHKPAYSHNLPNTNSVVATYAHEGIHSEHCDSMSIDSLISRNLFPLVQTPSQPPLLRHPKPPSIARTRPMPHQPLSEPVPIGPPPSSTSNTMPPVWQTSAPPNRSTSQPPSTATTSDNPNTISSNPIRPINTPPIHSSIRPPISSHTQSGSSNTTTAAAADSSSTTSSNQPTPIPPAPLNRRTIHSSTPHNPPTPIRSSSMTPIMLRPAPPSQTPSTPHQQRQSHSSSCPAAAPSRQPVAAPSPQPPHRQAVHNQSLATQMWGRNMPDHQATTTASPSSSSSSGQPLQLCRNSLPRHGDRSLPARWPDIERCFRRSPDDASFSLCSAVPFDLVPSICISSPSLFGDDDDSDGDDGDGAVADWSAPASPLVTAVQRVEYA